MPTHRPFSFVPERLSILPKMTFDNHPDTFKPLPQQPLPAPPPEDPRDSPVVVRGRLRKPVSQNPPPHSRGSSAQFTPRTSIDHSQPSLQDLQQGLSFDGAAPTASLLSPPPVIGGSGYGSRSSSADRSRPGTPGTSRSRPSTPSLVLPAGHSTDGLAPASPATQEKKKKGWFSSSKKDKEDTQGPWAYIAGHPQKPAYDTDSLVNARPVPELWNNEDGNLLVHLFPRTSGKGPSFKIDSAVIASSPVLVQLAFGDPSTGGSQHGVDRRPLDSRTQSLTLQDVATPPATPKRHRALMDSQSSGSSRDSQSLSSQPSDHLSETHLYVPIKLTSSNIPVRPTPTSKKSKDGEHDPGVEDLQTLIDIRNFFAFLTGGPLVATQRKSSFFHIFMTISGILKSYKFSNLDGSTFGEVASSSFDSYVEELRLADVRTSREKTIEGLVLSERMKSVFLFNEAFTHAAGKHEDLINLKSSKFALISPVVQNRLIRASMDLDKRIASTRLILTDFDFPSLFTGIMASKTSVERKEGVRFEAWKEAFGGFRKNILGILKNRYGAWPPKASSKKNDLETSGLNRVVLKDLYQDLSSVYDLLVDRTSLTSRTSDGTDHATHQESPTTRALRAVLSEYDRSSPPVKPPVPFDLPRLPTLTTTRPDFGSGDKKKDIKSLSKKLKDDEIATILRASWNDDTLVTPFIDAFREMEKRAAHGCTIAEIVDLRLGQWIFIYVVLQALPMLACDAPGLNWTQGVEYFLCEPPRSGVPWATPHAAATAANAGGRRTWFSVGDGTGVVSLPSDLVEHGVEGIYHRSHCWLMAEKWSGAAAAPPLPPQDLHHTRASPTASPGLAYTPPLGPSDSLFLPPPGFPNTAGSMLTPNPDSRPASRTSTRHSSWALGLEALPLPATVTPDGVVASSPRLRPTTPLSEPRPVSVHVVDSSKTFDAILGDMGAAGKKGKKK